MVGEPKSIARGADYVVAVLVGLDWVAKIS